MIFRRRKRKFTYILEWSTDGTWKLSTRGHGYGYFESRKAAYQGFVEFLKRFIPEPFWCWDGVTEEKRGNETE